MSQQTAIAKNKNKRREMIRKRIRFYCVIILIAALIIFICIAVSKSKSSSESKNTKPKPSTDTVNSALSNVSETDASVSSCLIYGTHLNVSGSFENTGNSTVASASLVIRQGSKSTKLSDLTVSSKGSKISFYTSDKINKGIYLDDISTCSGCIILEVTYSDGSTAAMSLKDDADTADLDYYTVTKNGSNREICISFEKSGNHSYLAINCTRCELPDDVYDIVIDAGHGGTDSGAIALDGTYESTLTLSYAKSLKSKLEAKGFKVLLTRDGTEDASSDAPSNMFGSNGRVTVTCASKAKYCICIHFNSDETYSSNGGIEIYSPADADLTFAKTAASDVVKNTGFSYSALESWKVSDGVYVRTLSESKYNITPGVTNYYYMIRETGGRATGAYMDGTNTTYGANPYMDSSQGVETYLFECGYLTVKKDLNLIKTQKSSFTGAIADAVNECIYDS